MRPWGVPAETPLLHPLAGLSRRLQLQLVVLFLGRGTGSWTMRFAYPFLPTIARGLDVSLAATGALLGAVELLGVLAPAMGKRIDRGDQRTGLLAGSAALGIGGVTAGLAPGVAGFALGMLVLGAGFISYTVASSAWTGTRVPIERRGGAIGLLETSWAVSLLLGVPAAAAMVVAGSWRTPFLVIGVANLVLAVVISRTIEPRRKSEARPAAGTGGRRHVGFATTLALLGMGGMMVFGSYGAWLEAEHGFDPGGMGALAVLLGAGELIGSGAVMLRGDRIGLRRTMAIGMLLLAPALALLSPLGGHPVGALVLLVLVFVGFELAFVAGLTIASELDRDARGAAIGIAIAGATIGRAAGAALGVWVLVEHGMAVTGGLGGGIVLGALALSRRSVPSRVDA